MIYIRPWRLMVALAFMSVPAFAQSNVKMDSGIINGAKYKILFPEEWNKKLVMYAHGYEFEGGPSGNDDPGFVKSMSPFLERGFAVAASAYSHQGWALPEGIENTEDLRNYFFKKYGKPDSAFIAGTSMGGGVALGTIENFPQYYNGAFPMCPFASRPYLIIRKEYDLIASFNVFFPGIMPSLVHIFDTTGALYRLNFGEVFKKAEEIKLKLNTDSITAAQLAKRFDLKLQDLPFSVLFGEGVLRDIARKARGNPFDNTNTVYAGFPEDVKMNQQVERMSAAAGTVKYLDRYDRTGLLSKPVVMLHTVYDNLIPASYAVTNYDNLVHQKGTEQFLVVK
jgi:pimeloyl-ACP methyl ester carboxylesterase